MTLPGTAALIWSVILSGCACAVGADPVAWVSATVNNRPMECRIANLPLPIPVLIGRARSYLFVFLKQLLQSPQIDMEVSLPSYLDVVVLPPLAGICHSDPFDRPNIGWAAQGKLREESPTVKFVLFPPLEIPRCCSE